MSAGVNDPLGVDARWEELYRRLERPLFNLAYRYTWDRGAAEDVVHEAFLKVWQRRADLRAETAERYLWVATTNVARNRRRWRKLREYVALDDRLASDVHTPEETAEVFSEQSKLKAAIDALPERLRTALLWSEFSSLSYAEAAALLKIPSGTFASRRNLAVQRLRKALTE